MPKADQIVTKPPKTPMDTYRDVSDWKGKCAKLVEALKAIKEQSANRIAIKALLEFERNK